MLVNVKCSMPNAKCQNPFSIEHLAFGIGSRGYAYMPRIFVTVATRLIATT